MNDAHIHLLFTHFPIMGSCFGLLVLGIGLIIDNVTVRKTGYAILVFTALLTIPAFISGEGAEEIKERTEGVSHRLIHEHEENGEIALWLSEVMGILAALAFYAEHTGHRWRRILSIVTLIFTLLTFGVMTRTGNSGGKISHPEITLRTALGAPSTGALKIIKGVCKDTVVLENGGIFRLQKVQEYFS